MPVHVCHAIGCKTPVPPKLFMCARHWRMVPQEMKDHIWATYVTGQERNWDLINPEYFTATSNARKAVKDAESRVESI